MESKRISIRPYFDELPTELQRVDPEGRFLYRHSINEPIEIKNRRN